MKNKKQDKCTCYDDGVMCVLGWGCPVHYTGTQERLRNLESHGIGPDKPIYLKK